jgi:hypothetical protein
VRQIRRSLQKSRTQRQLELIAEDRDVRHIRNDIDLLAGDIYSRITNLYDIKEIRHVDNRINNSIFRIEQRMNWLSTDKQQYLKPFFEEVIDRYRNNISVVKEREKAPAIPGEPQNDKPPSGKVMCQSKHCCTDKPDRRNFT